MARLHLILLAVLAWGTGCASLAGDGEADGHWLGGGGDDAPGSFTGFAEFAIHTDVYLSASATLTGTPYTGRCDGCEYTFVLDSTIVDSYGPAGLIDLFDYYLFNTTPPAPPIVMAYASAFTGEYSSYYSAMLFGYLNSNAPDATVEYWSPFIWSDTPGTDLDMIGPDISWTQSLGESPYSIVISGSGTLQP